MRVTTSCWSCGTKIDFVPIEGPVLWSYCPTCELWYRLLAGEQIPGGAPRRRLAGDERDERDEES